MPFWWVNQNKTYRHEVPGGYLWSPKANKGGLASPYYDNMLRIRPADWVFSYAGAKIRAVGVALNTAYESPKPAEFGAAGSAWSDLGWRVDVDFAVLPEMAQFGVPSVLEQLRPAMPAKYSPVTSQGRVNQAYLYSLPDAFARVLISHIDSAVERLSLAALLQPKQELSLTAEDRLEHFLQMAPLPETEKMALISARRGQGRFRDGVSMVEKACRFTGVANRQLLIASHIQPWRECRTNEARLDPFNGLMLTPTYDRLFDRGFVTFEPDGRLLVSPTLPAEDIRKIRMDVDLRTPPFLQEQRRYLEYHREFVFRETASSESG